MFTLVQGEREQGHPAEQALEAGVALALPTPKKAGLSLSFWSIPPS